jgi:hypothetical protein
MSDNRWQLAMIWVAGAAVSGPLGVVLHEFAHFITASQLGFPGTTMHSASISYARSDEFWSLLASGNREAAAAIYPLREAGLVALAGPAATLLLSVAAALALRARAMHGFVAAVLAGLALMAGVRALTGVYYILHVRPTYPGARPFFDEINTARAFDIPVDMIVWPSVAVLLLCWVLVLPRLRPGLLVKLPASLLGPVLGIAAWAFVGPMIVK